MHVRHGQLRWEPTVAPAERLARFGVPVSRALSRDLQAGGADAGATTRGAAYLRQGSGGCVTEGDSGRRAISRGRWARSASAAAASSSRARCAHPVRTGVANGRQPAARSVAQRRAAVGPPTAESMAAARSMSRRRRPPAPRRWPAGKARRRAARCRPIPVDFPAWSRSTARRAPPPVPCRWASSSARGRSCPAPACCSVRRLPMRDPSVR